MKKVLTFGCVLAAGMILLATDTGIVGFFMFLTGAIFGRVQ